MLTAVATACGVQAATVATAFTNFGPGPTYNATQGNPVGNAFDGNDYGEADSFVSAATGRLNTLRIALSCVFCTSSFSVNLAGDMGNSPGALLEYFTVPSSSLGLFGASNPPLLLTSVLTPALTAGTRYWVTTTSDLTNAIAWNLNSVGEVSPEGISTDAGAAWFAPSGLTPGALEVTAVVPEPGTLGLLALAGVALGALRGRQRRGQN